MRATGGDEFSIGRIERLPQLLIVRKLGKVRPLGIGWSQVYRRHARRIGYVL